MDGRQHIANVNNDEKRNYKSENVERELGPSLIVREGNPGERKQTMAGMICETGVFQAMTKRVR